MDGRSSTTRLKDPLPFVQRKPSGGKVREATELCLWRDVQLVKKPCVSEGGPTLEAAVGYWVWTILTGVCVCFTVTVSFGWPSL